MWNNYAVVELVDRNSTNIKSRFCGSIGYESIFAQNITSAPYFDCIEFNNIYQHIFHGKQLENLFDS